MMKSKYTTAVDSLILSKKMLDSAIGEDIGCSRRAINGRRYRLKHPERAREQRRKYIKSEKGKQVEEKSRREYLAKLAKNNARSGRPYSPLENKVIMSGKFPMPIISEVCQRPPPSFYTQKKKIKKKGLKEVNAASKYDSTHYLDGGKKNT
jgi:hypothetical protein